MLLNFLTAELLVIRQVYLRIHGYKEWYQYIYSKSELDEIYTSIRKIGKKRSHYERKSLYAYALQFQYCNVRVARSNIADPNTMLMEC